MNVERRLAALEAAVGGCPRCHNHFVVVLMDDAPEPRCPGCDALPTLVRRVYRDPEPWTRGGGGAAMLLAHAVIAPDEPIARQRNYPGEQEQVDAGPGGSEHVQRNEHVHYRKD
jgi:hypothetical protein